MAVSQCARCLLWERRGGTVFQARRVCSVLEDAALPAGVGEVLAVLAQQLAREHRCPNHEPLRIEPGSYLAEDVPI